MSNTKQPLYTSILADVALHYPGTPTLLRAVDLARQGGPRLALLHAAPQESTPAQIKAASSRLAALQAEHPEIDAAEVAQDRHNWRALLERAAENGVDLIVLGAHTRERWIRLLRDSSEHVLEAGLCDLLVVRPDAYRQHPPRPYARVLAAIDDPQKNAAGAAGAAKAATFAEHYGAELILLSVVEHFPTDRENQAIAREDQDPAEHQQAVRREMLHALATRIGAPQARLEVRITTESAARFIPQFAAEHAVDLLAIGVGPSRSRHLLFEGTAGALLHRSACDVLAVQSKNA